MVRTVKYCFSGLSRTCKDQISGFSRTHKTRFQGLSRIYSVYKHGTVQKVHTQISYRCDCITQTNAIPVVFLKSELTQEIKNCTQHFTTNFIFTLNDVCTRNQNFQNQYFRISGLFQGFPGPTPFSRAF